MAQAFVSIAVALVATAAAGMLAVSLVVGTTWSSLHSGSRGPSGWSRVGMAVLSLIAFVVPIGLGFLAGGAREYPKARRRLLRGIGAAGTCRVRSRQRPFRAVEPGSSWTGGHGAAGRRAGNRARSRMDSTRKPIASKPLRTLDCATYSTSVGSQQAYRGKTSTTPRFRLPAIPADVDLAL